MNVLLIHRKGVFNYKGGEQDQITNTCAALENMGVSITLAETLPGSISKFDLVHFFGLDACHIDEIVGAKGIPKVLTPVFWDRAQGFLVDNEYEEWPNLCRAS